MRQRRMPKWKRHVLQSLWLGTVINFLGQWGSRKVHSSWAVSVFEVVIVVPSSLGPSSSLFLPMVLKTWHYYIISNLSSKILFLTFWKMKNCKISLKSCWIKKKSMISFFKKVLVFKIENDCASFYSFLLLNRHTLLMKPSYGCLNYAKEHNTK